MKDTSFKHAATNRITEIYGAVIQLQKDAQDNVTEELGIETRDLCQDLRCEIERHDQKYALAILPEQNGEI